ncbi:hypothetical protein Snoj_27560 [Streptomyces nojiriensis]|uniref:Uncharacterized protein n=1 Tax=Streptomyces nojiriensis TaxID=66374 RepID=A0ABQ3SKU4_9ACTN|nr:hypothetical protein GCM10010205_72800 [Streptomyces nojiriensis]GHI68754.1 hypothetical protein Snoj_26720 [Streptomyces nojiriensis]GHI68838.1 hypothetical protein Snoj_27560 [Streptomyces nojiriensis]
MAVAVSTVRVRRARDVMADAPGSADTGLVPAARAGAAFMGHRLVPGGVHSPGPAGPVTVRHCPLLSTRPGGSGSVPCCSRACTAERRIAGLQEGRRDQVRTVYGAGRPAPGGPLRAVSRKNLAVRMQSGRAPVAGSGRSRPAWNAGPCVRAPPVTQPQKARMP